MRMETMTMSMMLMETDGPLRHWASLSILSDPDMITYHPEKKTSVEKKKRERVPVDGRIGDEANDSVYFTWRQSQCMLHFLEGMTQQEVARSLGISLRTIERYTKDMCVKLNCRDKAHLIHTVAKTSFRENADLVSKQLEEEF